jgi:hypothetical protein
MRFCLKVGAGGTANDTVFEPARSTCHLRPRRLGARSDRIRRRDGNDARALGPAQSDRGGDRRTAAGNLRRLSDAARRRAQGALAHHPADLRGRLPDLLSTLDPLLARRAIAATVLVFALVLLTGLRYRGKQRLGTSMALGATSGVLVGATSVGAPPVILYLLASSDPPDVTRANLTLFVTIISLAALGALLWRGMLDGPNGLMALLLSPLYLVGVWLGSRLYGKLDAALMRRWTLIFLIVVSSVVLAL